MTDEESWIIKTAQTYQQTYNFIKLNQKNYENPLSKMLFEVKAFADCFTNTKKGKTKLDEIYKDPIKFICETYSELYSPKKKARISIHKSLPEIEWMYYRDAHRFTKLNKKYYMDQGKVRTNKYVTFADLSGLKGHIEKEIAIIFNKVVKDNNIALDPLVFPTVDNKEVNKIGTDINEFG